MVVWGPDYACCGVPFGVGDEVGFSLRAVPGGGDGGGGGAEDGPTYFDDRHPMDPDDSPVDVRGRVEAIVAVHQRLVPVAGAHYRTSDPDDTVERARHFGDVARDALAPFPDTAHKAALLEAVDFCISRAH